MILWRIASNILPTKDKISRFNPNIDTICPLCGTLPESAVHIFISCHVARALWYASRRGFKLDKLQINSPSQLIEILTSPPNSILTNSSDKEGMEFEKLSSV